MKPQLVEDSFSITGIYTLNNDTTISNWKTNISITEQIVISRSIPHLINIFKTQSELFEKGFNQYDVKASTTKDNLVINP